MSEPYVYDYRKSLASHRAQERMAWDRYAAASLAECEDEQVAASQADNLLELRRLRFPGPRKTEE